LKIEISRATWRRLVGSSRGPFLWVVGALAAVTAAIVGVQDVFQLDGPTWSLLLAAFLVAFVLVSLATVVIQERWRSRNVRYALAMPALHEAYHHLRDLSASMSRGAALEDFGPHLGEALTSFAKAFSIIACRLPA
jgi:uncharacterized membrane protein YhaH (DUF805 family)